MPAVEPIRGTSAEPEFLLHSLPPEPPTYWAQIAGASIAVHIVFALFALFLGKLPATPRLISASVDTKPKQVTQLIAPRLSDLTQRAPNKGDVSKEFNLASLPPRPEQSRDSSPGAPAPPRSAQRFKAPRAGAAPTPAAQIPDTPVPDPTQLRAQGPLPSIGVPDAIAPPPRIEVQEKPKLAFERPGAPTGIQQGIGRVPIPKPSVQDALRQVAREAGTGGMSVGDDEEASGAVVAPGMRATPTPGKLGSSVQLLSDPQGADFIPYLRSVLSAVRRNWYAIIPESARMGRGGRTQVQFAIDRNGSLSKIVISTPSGAHELDLAAVAGVTSSNPFPPLPANFKGNQIRLQFSFRYSNSFTLR